MSGIPIVSRREFVKGMFSAGALVLCGQVTPLRLWAGAVDAPPIAWQRRPFTPTSGWASSRTVP